MLMSLEEPGSSWSDRAVALVVDSYFDMWKQSLQGHKPVKMQMYRRISEQTGRNVKSVERKCQNISAVLERIGFPWLPGLAPLRNYQKSLLAAVEAKVQAFWDFDIHGRIPNAESPGVIVLYPEQTPLPQQPVVSGSPELERIARKFDPALRDLRNRKTGLLAEELVYHSEIARLNLAGREDLARRVNWVSQEDGDGAGYDIRSYEHDGTERFLEVKTTIGNKWTPFYLSRNERDFAEEAPNNFLIFRLYEVVWSPKSFLISPPLDSALILEPSVYRASLR
jgi:hypothetical protein